MTFDEAQFKSCLRAYVRAIMDHADELAHGGELVFCTWVAKRRARVELISYGRLFKISYPEIVEQVSDRIERELSNRP